MWDIEKIKETSKEVKEYLDAGWEPFGAEGGYIFFRIFQDKDGVKIREEAYVLVNSGDLEGAIISSVYIEPHSETAQLVVNAGRNTAYIVDINRALKRIRKIRRE